MLGSFEFNTAFERAVIIYRLTKALFWKYVMHCTYCMGRVYRI